MALDKKALAVGTQVRVKSLKARTAGIMVEGIDTLPVIKAWSSPGRTVATTGNIGDIFTIVKKPRSVNGINLCRVADSANIEGEVYWTELRSNCEVI
jgi:hypothetical protein